MMGLLALMATLSVINLPSTPETGPSVPAPHAAHLRHMLQADGVEASIDASVPELRASMMRVIAKSLGEANLTPEELAHFETVISPVLSDLKQQFIDYAVQDYAALTDEDIDALIKANETPLAKRFITVMARSETAEQPTLITYFKETAEGISEAYVQNRPYNPKYTETEDAHDTAENRLMIVTGNSAMCDEAIQHYYSTLVIRQITQIELDKLSDKDKTRLRSLFIDGMNDLGDRLKALKRGELHDAFSTDELNQLTALYSFPAVQTKIDLTKAMLPKGRIRNQATIKAAFDEVVAGFADQTSQTNQLPKLR